MYSLPYFKEHDPEAVTTFMREHPFITLAGCDEQQRPVITQVPVLLEERGGRLYLQAHIMRQTDHHKAFEKNPQVLAVFTSPHTYVSATWYDNPHQASTWNYISVHARGVLRFMDTDGLITMMRKLTLHFEGNNTASTTTYDNLSEAYLAPLLKAIIGFEIEVQEIANVFKLSQNRDEQSFHNIINNLHKQGGEGAYIAAEMEKRAAALYKK